MTKSPSRQVSNSEKDVESPEKYIISQVKQREEAIKDAILQIQSLKQLLVVREEALAVSEQRNMALGNELASLIDTNKKELEFVQCENITLKQQLDAVARENTTLKQQLDAVAGENSALKQQLAIVAGEDLALTEETSTLQNMTLEGKMKKELVSAQRESSLRSQLYSAEKDNLELQGEVTSLTNSTATKGNQLLSIQQENASLQQQLEGALAADKHAQKDKSQFITTAKGLAEETRSSQTMIPGTVTFSDQQKHSGKFQSSIYIHTVTVTVIVIYLY